MNANYRERYHAEYKTGETWVTVGKFSDLEDAEAKLKNGNYDLYETRVIDGMEAEEKAKKEAETKAKAEWLAKEVEVNARLKAEMESLGYKVAMYPADHLKHEVSEVNGVRVSLKLEKVYSTGWSRKEKGERLKVSVGGYSRHRRDGSYPRKSDGTFSWDKIVAKVKGDVDAELASAAAEAKRNSAKDKTAKSADRIKALFGSPRKAWDGEIEFRLADKFEVTGSEHGGLYLKINNLTEEEAFKVFEVLEAAGVYKRPAAEPTTEAVSA